MQGRTANDALQIIDNAKAIEEASTIGLEIEAVPHEVGQAIDNAVDIFTFSIERRCWRNLPDAQWLRSGWRLRCLRTEVRLALWQCPRRSN